MRRRGRTTGKKRRADTKLRPDGDVLGRIMEASPAGITVVNRDGQITFANRRAEQILGLKKSEIVCRRYNSPKWRITTYDGQPYPNKDLPFQRVKATGKPVFDVRHAIQWPDGQSILLSINGAPLFDQSGRFDGMIAVVTNITSYVQSVSKLRESEERYRVLFEKSPMGIGIATPDGKVVSANEALQAITGYSEKELRKISLADMYENPQGRKKLLEIISRRDSVTDYSVRKKRKDGTTYEALLNVSPIHTTSGDLLQTTCIDITESKRVQEELEKSKKFLEEVMDAIPDLLFIRGKDLKYAYLNKAVSDFFGKPKRDLLGKTAYDLYPRQAASENQRTDMEVLEKGIQIDRPELTAQDKNGAEHVLQARKAPLRDAEGNVTHAIVVSRDITGRKQMEEELRARAQELQTQNMKLREAEALGRIGNWEYHVDSQRIVWSEGTYALYERDRALGPPTAKEEAEYYSADQGKMLRDYAARSIQDGQEFRYDLEAILPSGRKLFTASMSPIRDETGRVVRLFGTVQDITERRRMEEELRVSEKKFRQLVETAQEGIWTIDAEGKTLYANPKMAELLGYGTEELLGKPLSMFMDDTGAKIAEQNLKQGRQVVKEQYEFEFIRKDGSRLYASSSISPLTDNGGNRIGALALVSDITQRKQMEKELQRANAQYRAVVEDQTELICRFAPDGTLTFVNQAYCHYFNKKREELVGHYFMPVFPEDHEKTKRLRTSIGPNDPAITYDQRAVLPNGEIRWQQWTDRAVFDEQGRLTEFQSVGRDITERKRMEEELRRHTEHLEELVDERTKKLQESEERFRGIAERSFDMIITLDLDGRIRYASPAVMWITGYSPEEMLGQHFQSYLPEEDVAEEVGAFMEAAKGKIVRTQPLKIRRKDGSIVHIEVNASPMFSDEKIAGIQAIARDVTEKFTLAEMRERFISTVTHELRTPLASIKGYLDLILTEAPAAVSSEIQSSLQVVKRNADRLLSLTNDLLDIQRMTAGRLQLSMGAVNLKKIIEQSNADILPIVTERKQNLILEVPDELPEIQGDPVRLGQVFANLLSNASKFSPEDGNITLRVKEEKDTIRTQVSDSGIGIKKEDLAHIFEPFTTVQKPSYIRGTGLGLSITKGILEAHGGKIWAESQGEGKGATFTFTLPKPERED